MSTRWITALAASLMLSTTAFGCMPKQQAPNPGPTTSTSGVPHPTGAPDRHVYRLDFVLTGNDGSGGTTSTSFTLNLQEYDKGEVTVGKNVALSTGVINGPVQRQDVGLRVAAQYRGLGDDVLVDVTTELSAFDPPTSVRKMFAKGSALASPGKPALVSTLDDDHKHYQLMVTTTKLR